jgi:hypothetical protein
MKYKITGKTCSSNRKDEICIHFRRELERKDGFWRTGYRSETITMDHKQLVSNPVTVHYSHNMPVQRSNSAFPSFNPKKSSCEHSNITAGYTEEARFLYKLNISFLK